MDELGDLGRQRSLRRARLRTRRDLRLEGLDLVVRAEAEDTQVRPDDAVIGVEEPLVEGEGEVSAGSSHSVEPSLLPNFSPSGRVMSGVASA